MGPAYVPDEVLTLQELKLADFPKTVSGKIQKSRLAELVREYRSQRDMHADMTTSKKSIHDIIVKAFYKSTGIPVQDLDLQAPITNFADSISFMRVRDSLRKELGSTLTIAEMVECPNIASQIELLHRRNIQEQKSEQYAIRNSGSPSLDEMSIAFGGLGQAKKMRDQISIAVESKGFSWSDDVASVIPAYDYMQVLLESELINSWNFAIAIMADESNTQVYQMVSIIDLAYY